MKLLYIFPEEFTGRFAREYHVYRLAESLAAAGVDVTLAAAPSASITNVDQLHALFGGTKNPRLNIVWMKREVSLGPWKIRSSARFYRQLDDLIFRLRPDAAYTMHLKAAANLIVDRNAVPYIFEAHEIFADSHPENSAKHDQLFALQRAIQSEAHAIVAISPYLAQCLQERFAFNAPIRVQHDGIDEAMLLDTSASPDPHELIYAGSLQPWKGVPVAIEAMRLLPEFHLTVLGGAGKSLEELRQSAPANVTFTGQVARDSMRPFLRKASIGLMPNLLEPRSALYTFPLKLLEYSAAGKGIVASQIPVFDQLDVSRWTELVPSGSSEAIATAVRSLSQRGIDRPAAQAWSAQFLWRNQGIAMKQFLETTLT